MPELDGFEATKRIRSNGKPWAKHVPIIAVTANVISEDKQKCFDVGMNDFIPKPLTPEVLRDVLSKYINLQGLTKELENKKSQSIN